MVGHGGSSAGSYLADPTSPITSHCASIVATSTSRVNTPGDSWLCDLMPPLSTKLKYVITQQSVHIWNKSFLVITSQIITSIRHIALVHEMCNMIHFLYDCKLCQQATGICRQVWYRIWNLLQHKATRALNFIKINECLNQMGCCNQSVTHLCPNVIKTTHWKPCAIQYNAIQ